MIKDEPHWSRHELLLHSRNYRKICVYLDMPIAPLYLLDCALKPLSRHRGIILSGCAKVNSNTANAAAPHLVKNFCRSFLIDNSYAPSTRAELLNRVQSAGIVSAVHAWLNNDDSVNVESTMQRKQLIYGSGRRGIGSRGRHRKALPVSEDMNVAVACVRGHFEAEFRRGVCGFGEGGFQRPKQRSGSSHSYGEEDFASRRHRRVILVRGGAFNNPDLAHSNGPTRLAALPWSPATSTSTERQTIR